MTPTGPDPHAQASKAAQLLAEVLNLHAPHSAKLSSEETFRQLNAWLEDLEAHNARFVGPFAQLVLDSTEPPEPVRNLLQEVIAPGAQFSSTLEQIFLFGIISSIVSASVGPFLVGISNDLNATAVGQGIKRPVDPATIATAAGRGLNLGDAPTVNVPDWAYTEAAKNGLGDDEINLLASLIGLPPPMQVLFEMFRRGIITEDQIATGLREGDFRDDWISYATQLIHTWLPPDVFVRAAVQAQMTYSDAKTWAEKTGLDVSTSLPVVAGSTEVTPDMFGLAFAVAGRPPGPEELARAANRGLIDWTGTGADALTFQQGIAESDVKTKWTSILQALAVYVPPPRTVGTLLEHGAITEAQALKFWEDAGVPTELAQGYVYMTQQQHVGQDKLLAKGEITTGYYDGIFTADQATTMLGLLGYRGDVAAEILEVQDFRREIQAIDSVVRKVGTLYQSFRISAANATTALIEVGLSQDQAGNLLGTWDLLRVAPVRVPTTAEIGAAVKYGTLTQEQALDELAALGYQQRDAAIVLSAHSEEAVTPLPAAGTTTTG